MSPLGAHLRGQRGESASGSSGCWWGLRPCGYVARGLASCWRGWRPPTVPLHVGCLGVAGYKSLSLHSGGDVPSSAPHSIGQKQVTGPLRPTGRGHRGRAHWGQITGVTLGSVLHCSCPQRSLWLPQCPDPPPNSCGCLPRPPGRCMLAAACMLRPTCLTCPISHPGSSPHV